MSVGTGTLQRKAGFGYTLWPALIALVAVAILAVFVTTSDRDTGGQTSTVSDTAANTPTELSGGLAGSIPDTAANTPSELRGGISQVAGESVAAQIGRRSVTPRVGIVAPNANTPSETSGGMVVGGDGPAQFHPLP